MIQCTDKVFFRPTQSWKTKQFADTNRMHLEWVPHNYLYLYRPCPHFHDPHLVLVGQDMRLKIWLIDHFQMSVGVTTDGGLDTTESVFMKARGLSSRAWSHRIDPHHHVADVVNTIQSCIKTIIAIINFCVFKFLVMFIVMSCLCEL